MADLNDNAYGVMLSALDGAVSHLSLHTADPVGVGSHEVAGGTPAYARKAITFGAPSAGEMDTSVEVVFDVPALTTVAYVGMWSASTAGTFYGSGPLASGPQSFTGQGRLRILVGTTGLA